MAPPLFISENRACVDTADGPDDDFLSSANNSVKFGIGGGGGGFALPLVVVVVAVPLDVLVPTCDGSK